MVSGSCTDQSCQQPPRNCSQSFIICSQQTHLLSIIHLPHIHQKCESRNSNCGQRIGLSGEFYCMVNRQYHLCCTIIAQSTVQQQYIWIQLCKTFRSLPIGPFIQILHINRNHWVTVSNIYDSSGTPSISPLTVRMICSFFKPLASIHSVRFQIMNVKIQTNSNDCGLYVIASATQLALGGADPVKYNWDVLCLRQHLLKCLDEQHLSLFPCTCVGERKIHLGTRIRHTVVEKVYCLCKMPNDESLPMIMCDFCLIWYHQDCMGIKTEPSQKAKWRCTACNNDLDQLAKESH